MSESTEFDLIIIGGGMVGASLGCALRETGLRIAIVEAVPLHAANQPSYDDRTIALAYGSKRIFEAMGVWRDVDALGVSPIERIHISDRGRFGFTRLSAAETELPALGYVVETRVLGAALLKTVQAATNLTWLCPATLETIEFGPDSAKATVRVGESTRTLAARLVVAADGAHSAVRQAVGIEAVRTEYEQSAIVTNVTPGVPHRNTAYERFTDSGPLAILPMRTDAQVSRAQDAQERPMTQGRCGVVWTTRTADVETLLGWSDEQFLAELQERFGDRLGKFTKLGKRAAYPLALTRVAEHARERLVLVGNAAHTVHPVAGQGFNLGLRDVAALSDVIVEALRANEDLGSLAVLERYVRWRKRDNQIISTFTNALVRIFSNDIGPLAHARNLGLIAVDLMPPVKRGFIQVTSGLAGRLPRLARGLALERAQ